MLNVTCTKTDVFIVLTTCLLTGCTSSSGSLGSVTAFSPTDTLSEPYYSLETGLLSGEIGKNLDAKTRSIALETEYVALERGQSGAPVTWQTPSGIRGEVVPQQPYQVGNRDCRRYTHRIVIAGNEDSATGTACRAENGVWAPLS